MSGWFVTGTDTGVGKTAVTAGLLRALAPYGSTLGLKPVAAGCDPHPDGLRNADALALQAASGVRLEYGQVNPVALAPPVAPHLAAEDSGLRLVAAELAGSVRDNARHADHVLVEGAGGWRVPLNEDETFADLARDLGYPVVLVVAIRLGCLNHALLTAEAIAADGLPLAGWVANSVAAGKEPLADRQIETLVSRLQAPLLGCLPFLPEPDPETVASRLDATILLQRSLR